MVSRGRVVGRQQVVRVRGLRVVLLLLAAGSALYVGGWALLAPRSFFTSFPGLKHHWRTVGAVRRPERRLVRLTGLAWLVFSLPHLACHAAHLGMYDDEDRLLDRASLGGTVLLARRDVPGARGKAQRQCHGQPDCLDLLMSSSAGSVVGDGGREAGAGGQVDPAGPGQHHRVVGDALQGVGAEIDVSNVTMASRRTSVGFFTSSTRHLLDAAERAGVRHYVALSIVGGDRGPLGLLPRKGGAGGSCAGRRAAVLRATQFHEFAGQVLARTPACLQQPASQVDQVVLSRAGEVRHQTRRCAAHQLGEAEPTSRAAIGEWTCSWPLTC